ncbi:hypothetical protein ACFQ08_00835 [Streptosporangium algeriense]|uniref:50S ribosomal protein L33 n=1 Tax=Streptosporangium algeriense TaxID=1682748 RepID=A0ABW3DGV0_9ACTN
MPGAAAPTAEPQEKRSVMGWMPKIKVSVSLIKCGRCTKSYTNPLTHVCVRQFKKPAVRKGGKK